MRRRAGDEPPRGVVVPSSDHQHADDQRKPMGLEESDRGEISEQSHAQRTHAEEVARRIAERLNEADPTEERSVDGHQPMAPGRCVAHHALSGFASESILNKRNEYTQAALAF